MNTRAKRKINVRSIDFDGSQFHPDYIKSKSKNRLIETNDAFITQLAKEANQYDYDESVFMVGSNRQSKRTDDYNSKDTESCFPALQSLCAETNKRAGNRTQFRVDPYLLADTYGNRPIGENFTNAINNSKDYPFSHWLFDESKLTILYAQMHKIAAENPNDDITFDFYDDRDFDILMNLYLFFNNNRDLLPGNVKLRLHHYAGKGIRDFKEIKGEGSIDYHYEENIKLMAKIAGYSLLRDVGKTQANVLKSLYQGDRLNQFKAQRKTAKAVVPTPTPQPGFSFSSLFCCGPRKKEPVLEEQRRLIIR